MDLGVIMHKSAKPSRKCTHAEAEKDANLTVGTIQNRIVNLVKNTILRLYKCIVKPELEYYIHVQVVTSRNRTWKTEGSENKS